MSQKLNILYLSQYFPPEMGAPSARVFELSRRWVANGASVTILTGFPNHPTGVIPDEYKGTHFLREEKEGISVIRTYIYATANKGFVKRIFSYISFMVSSIVQGTKACGKQDIIIASSPQFFVGIAGYIISRLKRIPFIFEIRDLWPESIVQLGLIKNKYVISVLEWIEMFLYKKSDHIIAVADSTIEILSNRGVSKDKISVIKNGVDLNLFTDQGNQTALKEKYGFKDKFIVSYIGTHGLSHALDKVLETAELIRDQKEVMFLLVGEGAEKEKLQQEAKQKKLSNVIFVDQINKTQLPDYYALSDIVLVTLRKLPLFKHVIPSKIFEIMAMKRPIIISVDGEAKKIVEEADGGVFAEPENAAALKLAIENLYQENKKRIQLGENGREFVEKYFNRDLLADDYLKIITKLLI
ncbi:MAG: glycosyltransferase WbuB [Calditrichaeota bacterium]|nr:MAG: glycosyltransferase WbuB [Calditrichota bacterium]MBL1203795.1 glycosyltransferase WbuB [Calditrichota bacterium]NOG43625.1 glycosyltransferase family 4 protein [Calditrichota bacterium]